MTGKAMPKGMARGPLGDFGLVDSPFNGFLKMAFMKMVTPVFTGFRNKS